MYVSSTISAAITLAVISQGICDRARDATLVATEIAAESSMNPAIESASSVIGEPRCANSNNFGTVTFGTTATAAFAASAVAGFAVASTSPVGARATVV